MPVEFRCPHCQKLLSTPEGSAGKQAKCPACGAVVPIPADDVPGSLDETSWHPSSGLRGAAPLATAYDPQGQATSAASDAAPLAPTSIELGGLLTNSWEVFKLCWSQAIVGSLVTGIAFLTLAGLAFVPWLIRQSDEPTAGDIVLFVLAGLAGWWLQLGLLQYMLKLARGQEAQFSDLFSGGPSLVSSLVAALVVAVSVTLGLAFCIVPGIYLQLLFSQFLLVIIDRRAGPIESLRWSANLTQGNKVTILLFNLLLWAVSSAASTLTCGLSGLVVGPFWYLAMTVTYLMISGQPTAWRPVASADRMLSPGPAVSHGAT